MWTWIDDDIATAALALSSPIQNVIAHQRSTGLAITSTHQRPTPPLVTDRVSSVFWPTYRSSTPLFNLDWYASPVFSASAGPNTAVTLASADAIHLLSEYFVFGSHGEVSAFLERHRFLVPLLLEARRVIPVHFASYASTVLEVFTDEESGGYQELFALVQTHSKPEMAARQLAGFDHGWWIQRSAAAKGRLNFDVECL